ncbi:MAG: 50S ribosomal protein L10, partial [Armatimonadetes bacterium]|nr:50S ribosomal protein L10 [Armatimonadota bacterium]
VEKKYKDKEALVAELREDLGRATAIVITEYRGLKAGDLVSIRKDLRGANVELRVVKNTLLRRASEGMAINDLANQLQGPNAIALAFGEPTEAAKLLSQNEGKLDPFNLKGGVIESMVVDGAQVSAIAKLPSKLELQAKAVGAIQGPLAGLVFTLQGVLSQFVGTLQAKVEQESGS